MERMAKIRERQFDRLAVFEVDVNAHLERRKEANVERSASSSIYSADVAPGVGGDQRVSDTSAHFDRLNQSQSMMANEENDLRF